MIRVLSIFHPAGLCSVWAYSGDTSPSWELKTKKPLPLPCSSGFLASLAANQTTFKSFFCLFRGMPSFTLVKIACALQMKIEVSLWRRPGTRWRLLILYSTDSLQRSFQTNASSSQARLLTAKTFSSLWELSGSQMSRNGSFL